MWTKSPKSKDALLIGYDREMLRSAFVSLFWAVICYKKSHGGFALKTLADKLGINKSSPSRWFSGERPNWEVNTISDIAGALDVEIEIRARDRKTGVIFTPHGVMSPGMETKATTFTLDPEPVDIRPPDKTSVSFPSPLPPRLAAA